MLVTHGTGTVAASIKRSNGKVVDWFVKVSQKCCVMSGLRSPSVYGSRRQVALVDFLT